MELSGVYEAMCDGCEAMGLRMYLEERPSAVEDRPDEFMVLSLPSSLRNEEISYDGRYNWYESEATIEIFTRDDISADNPNEMAVVRLCELSDKLRGLFPIRDEAHSILLTRPTVVIPAHTDGDGFHYTRLNARLSSLV